ncbi:kelch-like protein 3 [Gigantopelta aegis]|uniref:kelch-like protein 3 n=1 Tax=Gigantopelta aegis TaxID=1735272 RepID=UPI001B888879|nr:kelch-like protein 3 [Gigantopelta aegis]
MATLKFKTRLLKTLEDVNTNVSPERGDSRPENSTAYHRQSDRRPKHPEQPTELKTTPSRMSSQKRHAKKSYCSPGVHGDSIQDDSMYYTPSRELPVRDPGLEAVPLQSKINAMFNSSYTQSKKMSPERSVLNENQNYYTHSDVAESIQSGHYDSQCLNSAGLGRTENERMIGSYLCNMWQAQKMCDVMIKVDGQVYPMHKVALAAHSDSFATRHCNQTMSEVSHIDLPRGLGNALKEILRYIYTTEISINTKNVSDILACAKHLGITKIIKKCELTLLNYNTENVLDLIEIAKKNEMFQVVSQMQNFICKKFSEITNTEKFLQCSVDEICHILSDDSLAVGRELDVFTAAKRWIEYQKQARLRFAEDALKTVRMIYISPEELVTLVEPDMFPTLECQQMLMNVFRIQALKLSGSYLIDNDYYPPPRRSYRTTDHIATMSKTGNPERLSSSGKSKNHRTQRHHEHGDSLSHLSSYSETHPSHFTQDTYTPHLSSGALDTNAACNLPNISSDSQIQVPVVARQEVIICIGGINPFKMDSNLPCQLVEEYNPSTNCWRVLTKLPEARHHHGSIVLNDLIYIIGGSTLDSDALENLANPTNVCYTYNYYQHAWTRIAPMSTKRMYHGVASLGGVLYAMGGENERGETLDTMEFYNPQTNLWGRAARMSDCKIAVATVSHNGLVYVIGGFMETSEEKVLFGTVECYNPRRNRWTVKNPLPKPVCHAGVVEVNNTLYLVGGSSFCDNSDVMPSVGSVFRYDEVSDRWDVITTLRVPRHDAGVACSGDTIFVVGGLTSPQGTTLADVEAFDLASNKWLSGISPLAKPLLGITCCSMADSCADKT